MDLIILLLLCVLTGLLVFLIVQMRSAGDKKSDVESILNDKFIDFSKHIRDTMDNTRKEVEKSKDFLSRNAIDTLKHLGEMNKTVGTLVAQQEKVQKLGQSLEYLLQAPKLRGNYGEVILEEMLERVLPRGIWERQYAIEGGEKVDAVIKFKDTIIPIDSKFPKEDYQKYLSAQTTDEKRVLWANYEKAMKTQVNSIREKYIKPEKGTSEFALLFIPSESIYYETIAEKNYLGDPSLIHEYASEKKVIPVSPNTFYAFLNVVMLGIRNIEIVRDAQKLQASLAKIEKDFELFYKKFEFIGSALEKAHEAYATGEGHVQRFKKNLDTTLHLGTEHASENSKELEPPVS